MTELTALLKAAKEACWMLLHHRRLDHQCLVETLRTLAAFGAGTSHTAAVEAIRDAFQDAALQASQGVMTGMRRASHIAIVAAAALERVSGNIGEAEAAIDAAFDPSSRSQFSQMIQAELASGARGQSDQSFQEMTIGRWIQREGRHWGAPIDQFGVRDGVSQKAGIG